MQRQQLQVVVVFLFDVFGLGLSAGGREAGETATPGVAAFETIVLDCY